MSERGNIYELGMMSDKRKIEAPSAEAAVFYYFTRCVRANVPLVAVYTENGEPFEGDSWWMEYCLGKEIDDEFNTRIKAIVPLMEQCRVVPDDETEVPFDTLEGSGV